MNKLPKFARKKPRHVLPPGPGRPKGVPNKANIAIRDMIEGALREAGGQAYLVRQSREQPVAFMGLVARVMPADIRLAANITVEVIDYSNLPDEEI